MNKADANTLRMVGTLAALLAATPALAQPVSRDELMQAPIHIEAQDRDAGLTVQGLVNCLSRWRAGPDDRRPPNPVRVEETARDRWRVSATLRSPAVFHLVVRHEQGLPMALLSRVEYREPSRGANQQLSDSETKRAVLRAVCEPVSRR
ncbi:MAG: hypothetical protein SF002_02410 [Alphaproteobacteria bacterium]|nr:hypothetical protein [Alphaproteobacteria bacterium]